MHDTRFLLVLLEEFLLGLLSEARNFVVAKLAVYATEFTIQD